ncbi:MAG: nitroreductase family protein [Nanoarchaeota archaeon]
MVTEDLEKIKTRRSIRKFKAGEVTDEQIKEILDCAMQAPSAVNAQPWHFVVIRNKLNDIARIHPYAKMASQASVAIMLCAEPAKEKIPGFFPQDLAAATQNILLAAHSLGLGSVWCGIYPNDELVEKFRNLFEIPEHITPFSVIPIGYPAETPEKAQRYKKEKVHWDKW